MPYTRALKFQIPLMSGEDVIELQKRIRELGYSAVGQLDGIFGSATDSALRQFQQDHGLKADGVAGPQTWTALFQGSGGGQAGGNDKITGVLDELKPPHRYRDSVEWQLGPAGVMIEGNSPETTGGEPATVRHIWQCYSIPINEWASKFGVPAELIIATICTETGGDPKAAREEPGYVSDDQTPDRVSIGLMQTLIRTARDILKDNSIDRDWLLEPGNAIQAGTAYIASQWKVSHFDPPKVACAYNAGSVYYNDSPNNRWKMRQYPINSSAHADRFVKWSNDCFVLFAKDGIMPSLSFYRLFKS